MLFSEFAQYLLELEQTNSRLVMTEILSKLFKKTKIDEIDKVCYLLQGGVLPQYQNIEFGLAERLVFKAFVSAFSLDSRAVRKRMQIIGDLGLIVEEYSKTTQTLFKSEKKLTIKDVYSQLFKLTQQGGVGSQDTKLSIIANLLQELEPLSGKYLVRIVIGTLRLGFSEMTILDALSWMINGNKSYRKSIEQAYNVRPDLGYIAKTIKKSGTKALEAIKPEVGVPILMAKAERVGEPGEIIEKIGKCAIELKYDGFRLQAHIDKKSYEKPVVKLYSRSLEEVTQMFPDLVEGLIKEVKAGKAIIEGEAVGYDPETHKILPFQEIVQRKRKYNIEEKAKEIPLNLYVFDLLYLEDKPFINKTYLERRSKLSEILRKDNMKIILANEQILNDKNKISSVFEKAVGDGLEGIMAKKLTGKYEAGARNWNWIKYKYSYSSKLNDTLDCLVMGYDLGKGKRTSFGIGAFLAGVWDAKKDKFVTIAKIGTGLTDVEWKHLRKLANNYKTINKPKAYLVKKEAEADVWLKPKIVVEIRADEITKSTLHSAGLALRFPRLEKFREDKLSTDISTLQEMNKGYKKQHKSTV